MYCLSLKYLPFTSESLGNLDKSMKIIKSSGDKWKDKIAENQIWECLAMVHKTRKEYLFFSFPFPFLLSLFHPFLSFSFLCELNG